MDYDTFLITNSNKFPQVAIPNLRTQLRDAPQNTQMAVMTSNYREPVIALVLSFFVGALGVDRFYVGDTGLGIAKLILTIVSFGIIGGVWWFVDLFLIMNAARRKNYERAMLLISYASTDTQEESTQDSDFEDF